MERAGISATDGFATMQNSRQFGNTERKVPFVTISEALRQVGLRDGRSVSMLKLDVEGYEFLMLENILEQHFQYINM
jgi:FkbM family methyltransferase